MTEDRGRPDVADRLADNPASDEDDAPRRPTPRPGQRGLFGAGQAPLPPKPDLAPGTGVTPFQAPTNTTPRTLPENQLPTIRDSIHKTIVVEPFVHDLMRTPQLQRMRRIRQLGGVYLVYPGANHTRFEHALGAYWLARQITRRSLGLDDEDAKVIMAGALLHDVGHGPFSHTSEELLLDAGRSHEDLTVDLVNWSGIASVLDRHDIEVKRVVDAVQGKGPHAQLVSGDLDVDRMDYLIRDAFHTGLEVGVDPQRLATGMQAEGGEVVLDERSLVAAESLFVTRFMMYPAVYLHHACRAIERMIVTGIHALHEADRITVQDLERLDDARLLMLMHEGPDVAEDMARRIEERVLHKRAFEGTLAQAEPIAGLLDMTKDPARRRGLEAEIAARAKVPSHHVLLDVPPRTLMKPVGMRVRGRDGSLRPFHEVSSLVRNLANSTADHWRFRVFAPREHRERVGQATRSVLGLDA